MHYPKLQSLYKRLYTNRHEDTGEITFVDKGKSGNPLIIGDYACEEFRAINQWTVTEKVDGTNIRVIMERKDDKCVVTFGGRTDNSLLPTHLLLYLQKEFTPEKMDKVFKESQYCVLFGEGYGPKIQDGHYYRSDASFILFDVFCSGWWFTREGVAETAEKLGICNVPVLKVPEIYGGNGNNTLWRTGEVVSYVKSLPKSKIARDEHEMEGIVARSEPQMIFRKGGPIMFKLKNRDFK